MSTPQSKTRLNDKSYLSKPKFKYDGKFGEPIALVPGLIPLLYKIPIKSIVAPLIIRFVYLKENNPEFNGNMSDL